MLNSTAALTSPQFLYVNGELRIDSDYTFAPGTELIMGEDAQIAIIPNANIQLDINTASIHGCTVRWNGIAVTNTSTLKLKTSIIKDSNRGIVLFDGSNSGILGNTFENNMVSISTPNLFSDAFNFDDIPLKNVATLFQSAGGIVGNTFTAPGNLLPSASDPFTNTCGIYLEWNADFNVGINSSLNLNTFSNLNCGVRIKNGNISGSDSKFQNIGSCTNFIPGFIAICVTGTQLNSNGGSYVKISKLKFRGLGKNGLGVFNNCYTGIFTGAADYQITESKFSCVSIATSNQGSYNNGIIENNQIDYFTNSGFFAQYPIIKMRLNNNKISNSVFDTNGGTRGMSILGSFPFIRANLGAEVKDNEINNLSTYPFNIGIQLNNLGFLKVQNNFIRSTDNPFYRGMLIQIVEDCTIKENNTELNPTSINGSFGEFAGGMHIINSPSNRISCNSIKGFAESIGFGLNCDGSDIYSNTMTNAERYLLFLKPTTITGVQFNKMNRWPDNNTGSTTKAEAYWPNGINAPLSRFTADQNQQGMFPVPFMGPLDWFANLTFPIEGYPCVNYGPPAGDGGSGLKNQLTAANIALLDSTLSFSFFNESLKWEVKRQLFEKLTKYPALAYLHPAAASFYSTNTANSLGQLQGIMSNLETALVPSNAVANHLTLLDSLVNLRNVEIEFLNQQISITNDPVVKANLIVQLKNKYVLLNQIRSSADSLISIYHNSTIALSATITTTLSSITPSNIPETRFKATLDIVLSSILSGNFPSFTNPQKLSLEVVAGTCGLEGGRGVYWARALLNKPDGFYNDDLLCLPPPAPLSTESTELEGFKVYPNPVDDILNIEIPDLSNTMNFEIHDPIGVCFSKGQLNRNTINVSELPSGVYILTLSSGDQKKVSMKFVKK